MNLIKSILEGRSDEWIHQRFTKYGKGEFKGPSVDVKVSKDVKLSATVDYVTLLEWVAAKNCSDDLNVNGTIIAKEDLKGKIDAFEVGRTSNKKGVYTAEVSGTIKAEALREAYDRIPGAYFLLNLTSKGCKIKTKTKLPKPGSGPDTGFCTATFDIGALADIKGEIFFDHAGDFREASASHIYIIKELAAPAGVKDPARIRLEAKRKGRIVRTVKADGVTKVTENEFSV
ncbi:MAG: hypothetical protein V1921_08390 [Candidatus Altiarchaeota archaeon]